MLHRFSKFVCGSTVFLLLAGSLVTSTESGLSVPDWPTTYGWNMFTFPPSKWVGGIFYEHGHRLIASLVGLLTIVLAAWIWRVESRRWMKRLGAAALAAVIFQGILGGITVLYFLPAPVSTAHAALAEIFFSLTVAIALFTSPAWIRGDEAVDDAALRWVATAATGLIFAQILIGAAMRHTDAGLAIPDFPLMFGRLIPDHWDGKIAVHFAHRVGALVVTMAVFAAAGHVWRHHRARRLLTRPAGLFVILVAIQLTLGALTVITGREVWVNSVHLVCGALVLATSIVITLRSWRVAFAMPRAASAVGAEREADRAAAAALAVGRPGLQPDRGARA
ncbi:MAG: cytochrome oxidase biogenesis protein CtaA [Luteitalea sp.]|nr:cytochrome oxidase biogenesis protein CtaA [Luteitalea sp.]